MLCIIPLWTRESGFNLLPDCKNTFFKNVRYKSSFYVIEGQKPNKKVYISDLIANIPFLKLFPLNRVGEEVLKFSKMI